jgi:hypothetical protein
VDDELLTLAKRAFGHEFDLSPEQAARLNGNDAKSLREDAGRMRGDLGMSPLDERERDGQGRFSRGENDMNTIIRTAAGR